MFVRDLFSKSPLITILSCDRLSTIPQIQWFVVFGWVAFHESDHGLLEIVKWKINVIVLICLILIIYIYGHMKD